MAHININFDGVPDRILPVPAGVYDFVIDEVPTLENDEKYGTRVSIKHRIVTEGEYKDRIVFNGIAPTHPFGPTALKNLAQTCKAPFGSSGLDLEDLVGLQGTFRLKTTVARDKETGEQREYTNVAEYLISHGS